MNGFGWRNGIIRPSIITFRQRRHHKRTPASKAIFLHPQDFFMSNLILLLACFLLGMALRRAGKLPERAPAAFNSFIIHISLPALTLLYVHDLRWDPGYALAATMAWMHFVLAAGFFWALGRMLKLPRATIGALMLTGGLGNTSFFGLPMIETFYGKEGLATGIIADHGILLVPPQWASLPPIYIPPVATAGTIIRKIILFPLHRPAAALALTPSPTRMADYRIEAAGTPQAAGAVSVGSSCTWGTCPGTAAIWLRGWLSSCCSRRWCCTWCMSS
jgi:hypothetical protein